jgi:hypothetical protein
MTERCNLSPRAALDLDEIWDYTAKRWGVEQAETYASGFGGICRMSRHELPLPVHVQMFAPPTIKTAPVPTSFSSD